MTVQDLPAVNATLNAISAVLLLTGYVLIRARRVNQHRLCMLTAFVTSSLFLISYVGLLVMYYRATSHAWLLNAVVTVGLLPVTLLGAAMIVPLASVVRRAPHG